MEFQISNKIVSFFFFFFSKLENIKIVWRNNTYMKSTITQLKHEKERFRIITDSGHNVVCENKVPLNSDSVNELELFFSNWKILSFSPVPIKNASLPAIEHSRKNQHKQFRRIEEIIKYYGGKQITVKTAVECTGSSTWTGYLDLKKMVTTNRALEIPDSYPTQWKIISNEIPATETPRNPIDNNNHIKHN